MTVSMDPKRHLIKFNTYLIKILSKLGIEEAFNLKVKTSKKNNAVNTALNSGRLNTFHQDTIIIKQGIHLPSHHIYSTKIRREK